MDSPDHSVRKRKREQSLRYSFLNSTANTITRMSGRTTDIALACCYVTFPLLGLTAVLLGLIYHHRLTFTDGPFRDLPVTNAENDRSAYYVDLSSTFVIFIASWISSLAPLLVGSVVTLAAYRIGEELLKDTQQARRENLSTPYQLSLILRFVNGSTWNGLWCWLLYVIGWGPRRQTQARPLTHIIGITMFTSLIGLAIFGADTWLHIATSTVNFTRISDVTSQGHDFSFSLLSPNCTSTNNSFSALAAEGIDCGVNILTGLIANATEPIRTLNNISNTITVQNADTNPYLQFLGISDSARDPSFDFVANSYGLLTQCRPITQECSLQSSGNMSFNCGNGSFTGAVAAPVADASFQVAQFAGEDLSGAAVLGFGVQNPYYTALAAIVDPPSDQQFALANDPEIVTAPGQLAFVLQCTTTAYDIQYSIVEGKVFQVAQTPSNTSTTNMFASVMSQTIFGMSNMNTAVTAGVQFAQTAQDVADAFALSLSKVTLSSGVQGLVKVPAPQVQQRTSILVAKIPRAPLFCLVGANLSFILLGAILAIFAWTASEDAREVQTRLTITGLVADRFEGSRARVGVRRIENMFDEYQGVDGVRIGIGKCAQGGYEFKTIEKDIELSHNAYIYENPVKWSNSIPDSERADWI